MHTRMLLGAWEEGLEGVSEEAAELMMLALQVQLIVTNISLNCVRVSAALSQDSDH